jgi:thioredoxin-like negative regulator of GroEL
MRAVELNDQNYENFITSTDDVVFIDFYSPSCGPCLQLLPQLDRISEYFKNEEVTISKVDISKSPKLAQKYMVRSVPFTVVIGKDKMVKKVESGLKDIDIYIGMIEKVTKKSFLSRIFGN